MGEIKEVPAFERAALDIIEVLAKHGIKHGEARIVYELVNNRLKELVINTSSRNSQTE